MPVCLAWCRTDLKVSLFREQYRALGFWIKAFSLCRIKAGPLIWDGGFPCDHKACSVEQWPSTCQSAVLCGSAEAEARGSLLEWVGWFTCFPVRTVKYESYLACFFLFTCHPGGKVGGGRIRGGGGSSKTRAKKQVWQELVKHQPCEAPSDMTGGWRPDYYRLKSHR